MARGAAHGPLPLLAVALIDAGSALVAVAAAALPAIAMGCRTRRHASSPCRT